MRILIAGLLILASTTAAFGQASGEVEFIGFGGSYRPDCWTPMLVRLTSESDQPHSYKIQVVQEDLDKDAVRYSQTVDLGGNQPGRPPTVERYWVYFRPQPTNRGLPDNDKRGLAKALAVNLCDQKGKIITALRITSAVATMDPERNALQVSRSNRMILCVSDGSDAPLYAEYANALGTLQNVQMVSVTPDELPDDVLGYEGVDAIVWFSADAAKLTQGTRIGSLGALQSYVRAGGRLVICQPAETAKIQPFASMLPIHTSDETGGWSIRMEDRPNLDVLSRIAQPAPGAWGSGGGPYKVARAEAVSDAVVDEWVDWTGYDAGPKRTPYIARIGQGLGSVTWVAQDLGAQSVRAAARSRWVQIWNRVFNWQDSPIDLADYPAATEHEAKVREWSVDSSLDVGKSLFEGLDLSSKTAYLVTIAVLFFIVYWLVSGPGLFFYLKMKGKAHLSWFMFGLTAVGATALTMLVVHFILRGAPELRHLSIVRVVPGELTQIHSRFGLYIPRDGDQDIELRDIKDEPSSYIVPMAFHPDYLREDSGFAVTESYDVTIHKTGSTDAVAISVPYRSTLKKLETNWIGSLPDSINGKAKAETGDAYYLSGTLTNNTGHDLTHVFLAFRHPGSRPDPTDDSSHDDDWGIAVGDWQNGAPLDLSLLMNKNAPAGGRSIGKPWEGKVYYNMLHKGEWQNRWYQNLRAHGEDGIRSDVIDSFFMLSLFDRLSAERNTTSNTNDRFELYRRGGRQFDLSGALAAGKLIVLAEAQNTPIPTPLNVAGEPIQGTGTTLYQFVLPMDRTAVDPVATQPTTRSTTRDAGEFNQKINQIEQGK